MPLAGEGGEYQVKWLEKGTDFYASVEFKYPVTFAVFDDFLAYEPDGSELRLQSLCGALAAGEPVAAGGRSYEREHNLPQDEEWPFNWAVITHMTRSVLHRAADGLTSYPFRKPSSEDVRQTLLSVCESAQKWLDSASGRGPFEQVIAADKQSFRAWRFGVADSYNKMDAKASARPTRGLGDMLPIIEHNIKLLAAQGQDTLAQAPQKYVEDIKIRNRWFVPCYMHGRYLKPSMAIHQILGYGKAVQGAPFEHRDDLLLLQLQGDRAFFPWHSNIGCVLQFWIRREALLDYGFDSVEATLECG
jgi:hypothetical protein